MNEKLVKVAKQEGFCCIWAFLEAHRHSRTGDLVALAREAGFPLTARAVRHQRRAYRRKQTKCEGLAICLLEKLRRDGTTP